MAGLLRALGAPFRGRGRAGTDTWDTPGAVAFEEGTLIDAQRERSVPWRLYKPDLSDGATAPLVIFSHGLGGSRQNWRPLGEALAENGYFGLFVQHQGSDIRMVERAKGPSGGRKALLDSVNDPKNMVNRFGDTKFVIDELTRLGAKDGPFGDQIDLDRIGMAGHSYGARTVLAAAGQSVGAMNASFKDPRVKAGVAISPSGGRGLDEEQWIGPENYVQVDVPILHITGTEDRLPLNEDADFDPYVRTLPFQRIPGRDQYLIVFNGAAHDDFGARRSAQDGSASRYALITSEATILFFDAYLKDNESAYFNLRNRLAEHLDPLDYYEFR